MLSLEPLKGTWLWISGCLFKLVLELLKIKLHVIFARWVESSVHELGAKPMSEVRSSK